MIKSVTRFSESLLIQTRLSYLSVFFKKEYLKQPRLRYRSIAQIYPPPGMNLEIPDWTAQDFLLRIGGGCSEFADKFENINEIFNFCSREMKEKGVPPKIRKYILNVKEQLRRGVLTFEYLQRRTTLTIPKKK